jgi:c-di-GMP phosphodiesterase
MLADTPDLLEQYEGGVVVARQPIFDAGWEVVAYELLYRSLADDDEPIAPESMTAGVLAGAFSELGLELLVGQRPAHVNVTREFLLSMRPLPLAPGRTVLELVPGERVDADLVEVLREAVDAGFTLVLDDFRYAPNMEPLLALASAVKLDLQTLTPAEVEAEVRKISSRGLRLIAERVEEADQYELCRELGFHEYQGYFFALPELNRAPATPTRDLGTLCALASTDHTTGLDELQEIVERDAGLSHKLLRYANSAHVSPLKPIAGLRHALSMIGSIAIRRWGLLLALSGLRDTPHHLLNLAVLRARMCELLAPSMDAGRDRAFTVGLFSLLDAITGRPMEDLVTELPFDQRLTAALLHHEGPEGSVLTAALAYERGEFDVAAGHIRSELLADAYRRAILWSDQVAPATA